MENEPVAKEGFAWDRWLLRVALVVWLGLGIGICIKAYRSPEAHTVYPLYCEAADLWAARANIYTHPGTEDGLSGYHYSPLFAAVMQPFGMMGFTWGGMVWSIGSILLFFLAVKQARRWLFPPDWTDRGEAALLLLTLPVGLNGIWNAQVNLPVISMLILAAVAIQRKNWWIAATLLAIPFWIKLSPLCVGLLLAGLWPRRLLPRLLIMIVGLGLLAFLFASPEYVLGQYEGWFTHLAEMKTDRHTGYRDAWTVVELALQGERTVLGPIALTGAYKIYRVVQLLGAGLAFGWLCYWRWRGAPQRWMLLSAVSVGAAWLMLLGPSTEFATYTTFAPVVAWSMVEGWKRSAGWILILVTYLLLVNGANDEFERLHARWSGSHWAEGLAAYSVMLFGLWLVFFWPRARTVYDEGGEAAQKELPVTGN